jgi:hypothetical protein
MRPHTAMCPAALESATLLSEGSGVATCPMSLTPSLLLGGLRRCHVSCGSGSHLSIWGGSSAATCPSASDPASPHRRAPALTRVPQLRTAPTSEVGSSADTCPMALRRSWTIGIKKVLVAMASSKAHVFLRHTHVLLRRLQDVRPGGIIMTCKPCRHTL